MEKIELKSISFLIDQLITASIKCFMAQDKLMASENTEEIAKYAKIAQQTNAQRCELMRAIDGRLGETDITVSEKTYKIK